MVGFRYALVLIVMAGCAGPVVPADAAEEVSISFRGSLHATGQTRLFPNDVMEMVLRKPASAAPRVRTYQLKPGAFIAVRDHLLNHPLPDTGDREDVQRASPCLDHGFDEIGYRGPDREVSYVGGCPDTAVADLASEMCAIIASHDPSSDSVGSPKE
ncbi:MAG: hypothetical protein ACK5LJ_11190 [Paracoccus sp. (in: a-proteobacteria)]